MARVVRRGRARTAERVSDGASRVIQLAGRDVGRQRPSAPVVGNLPRPAAQRIQKRADLVGIGWHALKVGERAWRGVNRVEQADDRLDLASVESHVQARLEEAPVPVLRRCGEQQQENMASRERAADLAPPVRPRGDVDVGYEAVDQVLVDRNTFANLST